MRLASFARLTALLLALLVAPACDDGTDTGPAGDGDDLAGDLVRPDLDRVVIDVPATSRPVIPTGPATDVRIPDSERAAERPAACLCPDDACVRTWIETEMGCDVCALLVCGDDDHRGGCVACPPAP